MMINDDDDDDGDGGGVGHDGGHHGGHYGVHDAHSVHCFLEVHCHDVDDE